MKKRWSVMMNGQESQATVTKAGANSRAKLGRKNGLPMTTARRNPCRRCSVQGCSGTCQD